jgi:hypothetical protein
MINQNMRNLGDQLGLEAIFQGVNGHGMLSFSSGGPLVGYVFKTPEEAVARFGKRIKIDDRTLRFSGPFKKGYSDSVYKQREGSDRQEQMEYAYGYLKKLLEGVK